jgi:hypothetical protein
MTGEAKAYILHEAKDHGTDPEVIARKWNHTHEKDSVVVSEVCVLAGIPAKKAKKASKKGG